MEIFWFFILLLLLFLVFATWPTRPYTRERWPYRHGGGWRYAPSGAAAGLVILLILLFWFGMLAIWWPWVAYY